MLRLDAVIVTVVLCAASLALAAEPTKDGAVETLKAFNAALVEKDWKKAATFFPKSPKATEEEVIEQTKRMGEEINAKGIEILAAKGKWGKLADVGGERAVQRAVRVFGVDGNACWGLFFDGAEAGFFWTGTEFKIVRCNNIADLAK